MAEVDYRQLSDTSLVMPNGQSLNVQRFTVNNQPWVLYPGKTPADGGTPLYVGTDGTNYQFYTYGPEDGYRLYQYHPAPGSPEDEKNLSKSQEVHTRAYGNDKPKKQFGGTMNYTSYLQGGGSMVQTLIEKVMQSQGQDQSALQQLVELAKEGNEEAIAFLQETQGQSASMKCGGRVKKKALGSKLIKTQKAKCGCELKKVGGRLIEVDSCTGLPVHRNGGMVKKFESPSGPLPYIKGNKISDDAYLHTDGRNQYYKIHNGSLYSRQTPVIGNFVNSMKLMKWSDLNPEVAKNMGLIAGGKGRFYKKGNDGLYTYYADGVKFNPDQKFARIDNNTWAGNWGAKDAIWDPANKTWVRDGYTYDGTKGWIANTPDSDPNAGNQGQQPQTIWRDTFGAGKTGKFGGKTYDEALTLQNEMLNAGWFNANLGTSGVNKNGADGMWGATSQKEYARYLAEKQRREEQAAAAAAAEAEKQELNNLQASSIRRTASDGMTNEALLAMDAGKAMSTLSQPDYERWMKLNQYQQGRNAALVYNGKRYNDETAYNAAVDAETARTAPKLDMESLLNIRGRRKRNNAYTQYQASMDKHVANNPIYSGPKALTQEQLSATSFKNGGKFNYKNYLQS